MHLLFLNGHVFLKVVDLKPTRSDIDGIRIFPFLNSGMIENLKGELPKYLAAAEDISPDIDKCGWRNRHEKDLPNRSKACKCLLPLQPSSGAAERVFSMLSNSFNNKQTMAMQDYIEISIMLQYNS